MLTTDQKGAIAETAIIHEAVVLGVPVFKPIQEGLRYDLVLEVEGKLVRVQCKWANRYGDVIIVRCYSSRRTQDGLRRNPYTKDEIDALAAYCPDVDRCYFLPWRSFPNATQIQLRLEPTRNNQKEGIRWAAPYEFAATLGAPGAVAQLGERLDGIQ